MKKFDYPVKLVCDHLFGETHTHSHRMVVGAGLVIVGVSVAKIHTESFILHMVVDAFGYGIHGLGVTPFLSHLEKMGKTNDNVETSEETSEVDVEVENVEAEVVEVETVKS